MNFYEKLNIMERDSNIQVLKEFPQHCCTTRFNHCNDVAVYSYRLARALRLKVDEDSLIRGAMLHDYYLYDTADMDISTREHWVHHPETALANAEHIYELNDKEKGIIKSHMWPLNPYNVPNSIEGWMVCIADKFCAVREVMMLRVFKHGNSVHAAA